MSGQLALMDWEGRVVVAAPKADAQTRNLARVEKGLAPVILRWCKAHDGQVVSMAMITEGVLGHATAAPDSVRRVLAQLRKSGHVEVTLLDRSKSLYRIGAVRG